MRITTRQFSIQFQRIIGVPAYLTTCRNWFEAYLSVLCFRWIYCFEFFTSERLSQKHSTYKFYTDFFKNYYFHKISIISFFIFMQKLCNTYHFGDYSTFISNDDFWLIDLNKEQNLTKIPQFSSYSGSNAGRP